MAPGALGELLRGRRRPRRARGRGRAGAPIDHGAGGAGRAEVGDELSEELHHLVVSIGPSSFCRLCRPRGKAAAALSRLLRALSSPLTPACCRRGWDEMADDGPGGGAAGGGARAAAGGRRRRAGRGAAGRSAGRCSRCWRSPRAGPSPSTAWWTRCGRPSQPDSGRQALHTHVSRLRAHLGPAAGRLQTRHDGYRLDLGADELDLAQARDPARRRPAAAPGRRRSPLLREAHGAVARAGARRPDRHRADRDRGGGMRTAAPRGDRRPDRLRRRRGAGRRRRRRSPPPRWPPTRCANRRCCC